MLVNRPKQVICKIGGYNIIVASDDVLEDEEKFGKFCQEFKGVLVVLSKAAAPDHSTVEGTHAVH